jgi:hypothetical protein
VLAATVNDEESGTAGVGTDTGGVGSGAGGITVVGVEVAGSVGNVIDEVDVVGVVEATMGSVVDA